MIDEVKPLETSANRVMMPSLFPADTLPHPKLVLQQHASLRRMAEPKYIYFTVWLLGLNRIIFFFARQH